MSLKEDCFGPYVIQHFVSAGANFPYHFLGKANLRIDPFIRNRLVAYEEFQSIHGVVAMKGEVSRETWMNWVRASMLKAPESAEASALLGPPQACELVSDFMSSWPSISQEVEKEVRLARSECSLADLLGANEELLSARYIRGGMRFFYNHFATTTTQHFQDDVSIGLQFVRDHAMFRMFVSHELRHVLLDQLNPYQGHEIGHLISEITGLRSYRQYRSPAVADIEEQMNKVFDAVLFSGSPPSLSEVEIVPIFSGAEGTVLARSFTDSLPLLTSVGLVGYIKGSLEAFLGAVSTHNT
jgi:hypothetical protein